MSEKKKQIIEILKQSKPKIQGGSSTPTVTHWQINGSNNLAVGGHILIAPITSSLPRGLEGHEDRLQAIFGLLAALDPQKQNDAVEEFYRRVQEAKRLDELEQLVQEIRASKQV